MGTNSGEGLASSNPASEKPEASALPRSWVPPDAAIRRLLPFKSHFANIAGQRMHYFDEGQGPVVLLFHGNPTWAFFYRGLIQILRQNFRVIAPDFLGCGLSDHPEDKRYRASDRIDHLLEFVDQLGLDRYSLVMHDWGGSIGTGLAVRRPEAIEKLVYLNTTLTETESLPPIIKLAASPLIGKFLTKTTKYFLRITTRWGVTKKLAKDVRHGYLYPYRTAARRKAIWDFVQDIPFESDHPSYFNMLELAQKLPCLQDVPVQIVWGLKDPCFHREMLNKVAHHFPQANVLEIPDASHLVLEDAPELANSTIYGFLREDLQTAKKNARAKKSGLISAEGMRGLYGSFNLRAREMPDSDAVIAPEFLGDTVRYQLQTYGEFSGLVNKYQRGLAELGLRAGDRVLMLVSPGADFLGLGLAVIGRGAIPVFVDPGVGLDQLTESIKKIDPDVFIGSPRAHILRFIRRGLFKNVRFHLLVSNWLYLWTPNLRYLKRFASRPLESGPDAKIQLIAYTSGATGAPKGVIYTTEMIEAQLQIFREQFGVTAGLRDLPLLPIFSLFNAALGVCSVFPPVNPARPLSLAPQQLVKIIGDLRIDSSFGSPTLWNKIAEYCIRCRLKLPTIQRLFMAGAPVSEAVLQKVQSVIPRGKAFTPYGATEALPVTAISADQINAATLTLANSGEQGTLVGQAVRGLKIRVVGSDQKDCATLEIGEVLVQGANVSAHYFENSVADQQAKIQTEQGFWHRMGDMGYLDSAGNLYFCGRKAHLVQTAERTYYSIPTERIFNLHARVRRSALIALDRDPKVAVVIEPEPNHWPESDEAREKFAQELRDLAAANPITAKIKDFYFHPAFPVDARHNAKIYRDRLALWVAEGARL